MGYRNCIYNNSKRCIQLFTWDKDGKRVVYDLTYNPYLYVEDSRGTHTSIFNTKLVKKQFGTSFDRNKFIKESGIKRIFENFSVTQQYLLDTFWRDNEDLEFSRHPLKIFHIDIETYSVDSFPSTENPTHTVNVITCHDSLSDKFYTFGLKPYSGNNTKVKYIHCRNEKELFIKFIEFLEQDYPDIITGWNTEFFDIPYLINRCAKLLGEDQTKRLSPTGRVYFRDVMGKFGNQQRRYYIEGISLIDYLDIYKRFTLKEHESYKLDRIAEIELGQNKVDYGGKSLHELADTEWDKFIDYNIQDVNITVLLDKKLQFIELLRMLAYAGLCGFEQAMGTLSVINGALCIKARGQGKIISTFIRNADTGSNPGAYVGEPLKGFQENVVSFDANSLYPNVMITLNLSPETKVGKVIKKDDGSYLIEHVSGKNFELSPTRFVEFIKTEELAITKSNFLFTQKYKGIVPLFVDDYYNKRVIIKKELTEKKHELKKIEEQIKQLKQVKSLPSL